MGPASHGGVFYLVRKFGDPTAATGQEYRFAVPGFAHHMESILADPIPIHAAVLAEVDPVEPAAYPAFLVEVFHAAPVTMRNRFGADPGFAGIDGEEAVLFGIVFLVEIAAHYDEYLPIFESDRIGAGRFGSFYKRDLSFFVVHEEVRGLAACDVDMTGLIEFADIGAAAGKAGLTGIHGEGVRFELTPVLAAIECLGDE